MIKTDTRMRTFRPAGWRGTAACTVLYGFAFLTMAAGAPAGAQDWFRTGTGLGVNKPNVAVADFVSRNDASTSMAALFSDVVRNDLDFSAIPGVRQFDCHRHGRGNTGVVQRREKSFGAAGGGTGLSRRCERGADAA